MRTTTVGGLALLLLLAACERQDREGGAMSDTTGTEAAETVPAPESGGDSAAPGTLPEPGEGAAPARADSPAASPPASGTARPAVAAPDPAPADTPPAADTSRPAADTTPPAGDRPGGPVTPQAPGRQVRIALQPLAGSGLSGQALLTAVGGGTRVNVFVRLPAGTTAVGGSHIHQGTCAEPGAVVVPVGDLAVAGGNAEVTAVVKPLLASLLDGRHIVAVHGADGAPAACGAIPKGD